jgi:hypothetical protein
MLPQIKVSAGWIVAFNDAGSSAEATIVEDQNIKYSVTETIRKEGNTNLLKNFFLI